ncbi:cytochrome P450 [Kitasatospora sp. MAA19]|uniref:cytochrome P450 n=1 Tax=Kitasatospora sp. MAA19 TaxID=3035090 RepID=UPI0024738165|nr:cytochrome P450 [Kitasatospora sp. MAA19]MDH6707279.1 cytochrome P450 [Kitasatospora sp. MAA19]
MSTAAPALPPLHRLPVTPVQAPHPTTLPDGTPAWLVTRYHDVRQTLTDPRFTRGDLHTVGTPGGGADVASNPASMFNQDGPAHRRLRSTVQRAFTARAIAGWQPWVAESVQQAVDALAADGAPADLVAGFTQPVPFAVTSRLMGLDGDGPDRLDERRLRRWTRAVLADGTPDGGDPAAPGPGDDLSDDPADALAEYAAYTAELIARRRGAPGEDLVSRLVQAADQDGGVPEESLVHLVCGLTASGNESVTGALGNALVYLLGERPDHWPRLADPDTTERVTERLLHFIPLGDDEATTRRATHPVDLGGVRIPAGAVLAISLGSANRDPAVFPDGLDTDLDHPLPAPTLAFSAGPHYCLGAWRMRLEMRESLHRLAIALPRLRLTTPVDRLTWQLGTTTRSPAHLPAAW